MEAIATQCRELVIARLVSLEPTVVKLAQKIDTGRTAPCSVHAVKVIVTHGLAAVPVLLAKWDLAVSKCVPRDGSAPAAA